VLCSAVLQRRSLVVVSVLCSAVLQRRSLVVSAIEVPSSLLQ